MNDKDNRNSRIFGISLSEVMARPTQKRIPTVIKEMIIYLQKNGLTMEGIFRKSSPEDQINAAKPLVDVDGSAEEHINSMDPFLVASLLKLYLKELPDSLLTNDLYDSFINSVDNINQLRQIIQCKLPVPHKHLTEVLILFIGLLLDNIEHNRLSPQEISMIFSSLIIRPKVETLETMIDNKKRCNLILMLLKNSDKIFPENKAKRSIIKKYEPSNITEQKKTLNKYKITLKNIIRSIATDLNKLNNDIENATKVETVTKIAHMLKVMKDLFSNYHEDQLNEQLNSNNSNDYVPQYISTTLLESGHSSLIGPRPELEDRVSLFDDMNEFYNNILSKEENRSFYAVYDGHSGQEAAELASVYVPLCIANEIGVNKLNNIDAIIEGIKKADELICKEALESGFNSGTTLVMAMIINETLYIANLGDSEIVIAKRKKTNSLHNEFDAIVLSEIHKPTDEKEKERITSLGGIVFRGRILGKLAVSRALGDIEYKIPSAKANFVSNTPYVYSLDIDEEYDFIILACDGLWDKVSYIEAVNFVNDQREKGLSANEISMLLCKYALEKGSKDNVTVIVVILKWRPVQNV